MIGSPALALGGTSAAGRFFRDLRKLHAYAQGSAVGLDEYGALLGEVLI
jgi:hypothetical protein